MNFKFRDLAHMGKDSGIPDNLRATESPEPKEIHHVAKTKENRPYKESRRRLIDYMSAVDHTEYHMKEFADFLGVTTQNVGHVVRRMVPEGYLQKLDRYTYTQIKQIKKRKTDLPVGDPKNGPVYTTDPLDVIREELAAAKPVAPESTESPEAPEAPEWKEAVTRTVKKRYELDFNDYDKLIWRYVKFVKPTFAQHFIDFSKWLEEYLDNDEEKK